MRKKITQKRIALMCRCTPAYVSRVLNNPKAHNTVKAIDIKRLAYDHLEDMIRDPLFLEVIKRFKPKTQEEEETIFEWRMTFKLYNNKLSELEKHK
jgi:predicted transcriptional regulator